jgi:chromosome segregation ATPase
LQAEISKSNAALEKVQAQIDALTEELESEKTAKSTAQAKLDALLEELSSESAAKSTAEAELTKSSESMSKLQAELTALTAALADEKNSNSSASASAESEIAKVQKAYAEAQAELADEKKSTAAATAAAEAEIAESKKALADAQAELDDLAQQLAIEKMEKITAQADLEAAMSKKPDTSEADALRKELKALKDQHEAALAAAQQESANATEAHLAVKATLEKVQAEHSRSKAESLSDFKDMHESLTQLVEEANKKAADLESHLKVAEANLKVKDAELAEAKVWMHVIHLRLQLLTVCR